MRAYKSIPSTADYSLMGGLHLCREHLLRLLTMVKINEKKCHFVNNSFWEHPDPEASSRFLHAKGGAVDVIPRLWGANSIDYRK